MWDAAEYRRELERLRLASRDLVDIVWTPIIDEDESMMFIGAALNLRGRLIVAKYCVTTQDALNSRYDAFWVVVEELTKAIHKEAAKDYA